VYSGRHGRQALAGALAALQFGVFFLQVAGVLEHDRAQVDGGALGEDLAAEPLAGEQRQPAGVVDVGVAQHDGVDRARLGREGLAVARVLGGPALGQAALEQHGAPGTL
jgi:hypothetical protein